MGHVLNNLCSCREFMLMHVCIVFAYMFRDVLNDDRIYWLKQWLKFVNQLHNPKHCSCLTSQFILFVSPPCRTTGSVRHHDAVRYRQAKLHQKHNGGPSPSPPAMRRDRTTISDPILQSEGYGSRYQRKEKQGRGERHTHNNASSSSHTIKGSCECHTQTTSSSYSKPNHGSGECHTQQEEVVREQVTLNTRRRQIQ